MVENYIKVGKGEYKVVIEVGKGEYKVVIEVYSVRSRKWDKDRIGHRCYSSLTLRSLCRMDDIGLIWSN